MIRVFFLLLLTTTFGCKYPADPSGASADKFVDTEWEEYQGGPERNQFSSLDQINRDNIAQLKKVWEYRTGDKAENAQIQCNPIIIDGVLYGTSPKLKVFALDAATGRELWQFNPIADVNFGLNANRGLAYWEDGNDKRLFCTAGPMLFAIDAESGKAVQSFGVNGVTSLKDGLGDRASDLYVASTTPGTIYKDLLILGTRVSEGADAAPGYIRAFNVRTGAIDWTFHTIPKPGEYGYDTWPEDAYQRIGGANSWSGMSIDRERGIVYVPTGSASFDFWGGNRKGQNLFANCILALNAETGERIWHFQTVHHDIWDRDLPAPPNLVTVEHDGKMRDAVAQITKSGFVFLLDRDTGEPLFDVEERPVAESDLKGEATWPTQPFPVKPEPFARQQFTEADITDISEAAHEHVKAIFSEVKSGPQFTPPSTEGTIIFPGFDGGGEWGGAAVDPNTGIMYVNANEMPWILTMVDLSEPSAGKSRSKRAVSVGERLYRTNCAICHGQDRKGDLTGTYPSLVSIKDRLPREQAIETIEKGKGFMPSFQQISDEKKKALLDYLYDIDYDYVDPHLLGMEKKSEEVPYSHTGYNRFFDPEGYPAIKPPWGTLNAIDLNKGEIIWKVPLGEFEELKKQGIPKTGTENYGGPVVTNGGLIFIAASKDEYFRAFDKDTGEELWKYKLPAGGYATPSTFQVEGKQYVVIACGGAKMGTKPGDSYIAFSLE